MHLKNEPRKVEEPTLLLLQSNLANIINEEDDILAKAKALAVAVAYRYAGCGQIVSNDPKAIEFLPGYESPEFGVLLTYPNKDQTQTYKYIVNIATLEGRCIEKEGKPV